MATATIIAAILAAGISVASAASSSAQADEQQQANNALQNKAERQQAYVDETNRRTAAIGERRQAEADVMARDKFDMDMKIARDAQRRGAMSALSAGLQNNLKNNSALRDSIKSYFRSSL